jgi:hypothetical protein
LGWFVLISAQLTLAFVLGIVEHPGKTFGFALPDFVDRILFATIAGDICEIGRRIRHHNGDSRYITITATAFLFNSQKTGSITKFINKSLGIP